MSSNAVLVFLSCVAVAASQPIPGCPTRGCRPTGSFSFQMNVPSQASVLWTRYISEGETVHSDLGCAGNPHTLLCPVINETLRSFVSLNPLTGDTLWTEKNLVDPPLPLMDINGRVIAFDGQVMTMLMSNGTVVPPVEKFDINMRPTYSLVIADDSIFVLVDSTGFMCSYDSDGVIHASMWLNRTDEGAYAAIATPVISGIRAYVLTQWEPFKKQVEITDDLSKKYRLWAIDIRPRTPPFMNTLWMFDFKTTEGDSGTPGTEPRDTPVVEPRVMTHGADEDNHVMVYVTLTVGSMTTWFIQDLGETYKVTSNLSSVETVAMSINDDPTKMHSNLKFTPGTEQDHPEVPESVFLKKLGYKWTISSKFEFANLENEVLLNKRVESSSPEMWLVFRYNSNGKHPATDELVMVDSKSGKTVFNPMLMDLFNASTVRVTSEVMIVTPTGDGRTHKTDLPPTVVLGVNVTTVGSPTASNYVVAIQKSGTMGKLLWSIPVPGNFEVKGQIVGVTKSDHDVLIAYGHTAGKGGQIVAIETSA